MSITPDELQRRAAAFERIKHSTEMEGGRVPDAAVAIIDEFVAGDIDEAEMMRRIGATSAARDRVPVPSVLVEVPAETEE